MNRHSATSDFLTAMCLWKASTKVSILPSGYTVREAYSIGGNPRTYICGRLA